MNDNNIYFHNQFEKWAHSAWDRLQLTPACDLGKVCDFLKIEYRREPLSYGVLGIYAQRSDNSKVIFIAAGLPFIEQRKVWAHEIGHALISRGFTGEIEFHNTVDNQNSQIERDCDQFAMHLLMPEVIVRSEVIRLGHSKTNNRIGTLAALFEVSKDDMYNRLRMLRL